MFRCVAATVLVLIPSAFGAKHHFTLLSDVHYDPNYGTPSAFGHRCKSADAPPMGQAGCDAPLALVESAFADINATVPSDSYLIFTGDWLRHGITLEESAATFRNLTELVSSLPHSAIPAPAFAITSLGNNDFIPDYYFDVFDTNTSTAGMFGSILREANLITDAENATYARAAFYARDLPAPNLRFLVLNTLPYSVSLEPPIDPSAVPDPVGQFAWMRRELADAKAKGRSVVLMSHVPPTMNAHGCVMGDLTSSFIKEEYKETLRGIIAEYNTTIVYQFYGHSHQVSFLADDSFHVPGLVIPSITKIFGNTASYLTCDYDDVSRTFSNFRMRHLDNSEHTWSYYVAATGAETMDTELGPISTLAEARATSLKLISNTEVWDRYAIIHAGGVYADMWPDAGVSEDVIRLRHTCSILAFSSADYAKCLEQYGPSGGGGGGSAGGDGASEPFNKGYIALIVVGGVVGLGALTFMLVYARKHFMNSAERYEGNAPLNEISSS